MTAADMLRRLDPPPLDQVTALAREARAEGYEFLDRLLREWQDGRNRFVAPGELLLGAFEDGALVAIGGIHQDPYLRIAGVGRLRRVYVRPAWRSRGLARELVGTLVAEGRLHYRLIRLRVPDQAAARFYEAIGFAAVREPEATHVLQLG